MNNLHALISSYTGNFTIDTRESLVTIIFLPHLIVKSVIKHGMEFLFSHVRVGIKHLKSAKAKKPNVKRRVCTWK